MPSWYIVVWNPNLPVPYFVITIHAYCISRIKLKWVTTWTWKLIREYNVSYPGSFKCFTLNNWKKPLISSTRCLWKTHMMRVRETNWIKPIEIFLGPEMKKVSCLLTVYYLYPVVRTSALIYIGYICFVDFVYILKLNNLLDITFIWLCLSPSKLNLSIVDSPIKTWHKWPTICW